MPAGPVVLNNTPLVALAGLGRLDLLKLLFGEVVIPPTVREEFLAIDTAQRQAELIQAPWIHCISLRAPSRTLSFGGLDRGEAEVLALAEEADARLVVIDERKARRYAERLGLALTGTLGVLLLAKEKGFLTSVAPAIQALEKAGLHVSHDLVRRTLLLAGERTDP